MVFKDKIEALVTPSIIALGYEFWGLEYITSGYSSILRIYLEKPGGIDINDCVIASNQISAILEVENPINNEFKLEISSPGMDRQLFKPEQYSLYLNHKLQIKTSLAVLGRSRFKGFLKEVRSNEVMIEVDNEFYDIPFNIIEKANLAPDI